MHEKEIRDEQTHPLLALFKSPWLVLLPCPISPTPQEAQPQQVTGRENVSPQKHLSPGGAVVASSVGMAV